MNTLLIYLPNDNKVHHKASMWIKLTIHLPKYLLGTYFVTGIQESDVMIRTKESFGQTDIRENSEYVLHYCFELCVPTHAVQNNAELQGTGIILNLWGGKTEA